MTTIGTNIMQKRKELGMTQEELAKKMGYKSKSTINKIEKGINDITQSNIVKFAEVLSTTPACLMGWDVNEIETISNIQNDANTYEDEYESGIKQIAELGLTAEELNAVLSYASYIKSKRE